MAYTAEKPRLVPSSSELRDTIPGWGADLDPQDRPAVPKEKFNPGGTGAHWEFPQRQIEQYARERTPEHKFLTPVFGTACPPKGVSGVVRRYAYRFSEGRTAHWLLLVLADRIDVFENGLSALLRGRPDNPILETGILSELEHGGLRARRGRIDTKHQLIDFFMFASKGLLATGALFAAGTAIGRAVHARFGAAGEHTAPADTTRFIASDNRGRTWEEARGAAARPLPSI